MFDQNGLRIGDYVLFKDVSRALFLAAEGILRTEVECTDGVELNIPPTLSLNTLTSKAPFIKTQ
jgi:hypothetical protein